MVLVGGWVKIDALSPFLEGNDRRIAQPSQCCLYENLLPDSIDMDAFVDV